jgi:hypothetical protein
MALFGIQGIHGKYGNIGFGSTLTYAADDNVQCRVVTEIAATGMVQQGDLVV